VDAAKLDAAAVRAVVVAETESGLTSAIGDLPGSLSGAPTGMTAGPPTRPDHQQEGVKIHKIAPRANSVTWE
jgi:hypothetical protein